MKLRGFRAAALVLALAVLAVPALAAEEAPSAWAQAEVEAAREAGLVPEALDGKYDAPITRAEFCALAASLYRVWEAQGLVEAAEPQVDAFTDCGDEDVLLCAALGVVNGVGDGRFAPDDPIARQEAAVMLHRLAGLRTEPETILPHVFADGADLRSWSREGVYWAYARGVMAGVGDNRFDPDGPYTREQSMATVLRLYDRAYAVPPEPEAEEEPPYREVTDNVGVGVHREHVEDAEGNILLADLWDCGGIFYETAIFGKWVSVMAPDFRTAMYNWETGQLLEGWQLESVDEASGAGWAIPAENTVGYGYARQLIRADGTMGRQYAAAGVWRDGRAMVWSDRETLSAIDRDGDILWSCPADASWRGYVIPTDGTGDRLVVNLWENGNWLIQNGQARFFPSVQNLRALRWSDSYIVGENGYYTLYGPDGTALYGPFPNAMDEVGQDLYTRWVNDWTYEYFRCPAGGAPQVLFTVYVVNGRPGDLPTDGAGVYALRTDTREITCFDRFGDTLGVLETDIDIDIFTDITFEDGCVLVTREAFNGEPAHAARYLPTGERLE